MVLLVGVEPTIPKTTGFKSAAYANSATRVYGTEEGSRTLNPEGAGF